MKQNKNIDYLLLIILLTASILRLYNIDNMHLFNDELSALSRTHYNSFSELIKYGVKQDTHPALIQVFLYYYTKIFGDNDVVLKLPFIFMSIVSVFLVYKISLKFFNKTTAYLSSAMFATMQYAVWYGQTFRPYSSGVFFILFGFHFLQKFFFNENIRNKDIAGYIIFMTLASYNHYFSLLTAFIIGVSGFLFVKKKYLQKYFIANLLIVALFIPHLGITLYHFSLKGLNWLSYPDLIFFLRYTGYIFNYCLILSFFVISVLFTGIFIKREKKYKYSFLFFSIFFVLGLIQYLYSIYRQPVLQFAGLIFGIPFFYIFLFSFIKEQKQKINIVLTIFVLILGIYSLIFVRWHYKVTYNTKFYQVAKQVKKDIDKYGYKKTDFIFKLYGNFYITKYLNELAVDTNKIKASYYNQYAKEIDINIKKQVYSSESQIMGFANLMNTADLVYLNIIKEKYPYIKSINDFYFSFSKTKSEIEKNSNILDTIFNKEAAILPEKFSERVKYDSLFNTYYYDFSNTEWGPDLQFDLDSITNYHNNIVVISAKIKVKNDNNDVSLVSEINKNGENLHWSDAALSDFILEKDSIVFLYKVVLLQDINIVNATHKVYLWNKNKTDINLYSISYTVLQGYKNPYGLYWYINRE